MNLFKLTFRPLYYIKRPWRFFRELRYSFKYAWQRATKGYSFYDSMDMDDFLLHVIPGMLRDIANSDSYPGIEPFEEPEKWRDWCNSLADVFESLQEENWSEGSNEWEEKFHKAFEVRHPHPNLTTTTDMTKEEADEVCKMYFEREKELAEERQKLIENAFNELSQHLTMMYIQEVNMFYTKETAIARIDYRINLLRARDEMANLRLIKALEREKRNLENQK